MDIGKVLVSRRRCSSTALIWIGFLEVMDLAGNFQHLISYDTSLSH